jgi:nucleoside-diphosphate-sugar epimerase
MQVLITGGSGFLGAWIVKRLAKSGHQIRIFDIAANKRAYWEDDKLASIRFRPFVVYGPGRTTGLTAGPSLACRAAALDQPYTIPYSGSAGLIYIDDVAAAYEAALGRELDGAHVFNMPGEVAFNDQVIAETPRRSRCETRHRRPCPAIHARYRMGRY